MSATWTWLDWVMHIGYIWTTLAVTVGVVALLTWVTWTAWHWDEGDDQDADEG